MRRNRRCFGWRGVPLALQEAIDGRATPVQIRSPHLARPVWLRPNTTDVSIYHQIFVDREYDFALTRTPRVIVDAGANVGFSPLYFAQQFPQARIVALEPEPSNLELLRRNVAGLPAIEPVPRALWHEIAELDLHDPGVGRAGLQKDGFQTLAGGNSAAATTVSAIDLDTLMRDRAIDHIDVLKIDIEGAEREVFGHAGRWLDRVDLIVVELHDRVRPGCSRAFYAATAGFPVEWHHGEHVVVARQGLLAAAGGSR